MKNQIAQSLLICSMFLASLAGADCKDLPTLHTIGQHLFTSPYSCHSSGYQMSALFLSEYARQRNAPDLLYNGACGTEAYIESATAGDDIAMISDLGTVSLESVSAEKALNYDWTVGHDNAFKRTMPVQAGHTYAVIESKGEIRALFVIHVDYIVPDGPMRIRYAVKSYAQQQTMQESPGFDWGRGNK